MRKLATIEAVLEVIPIENANRIEVARVRGWKTVVRKDEFKAGDLCVYFEIDSVLPKDERYAFLGDSWSDRINGYRLKTRTMRGQLSQGLIIPIDKFPEITNAKDRIGEDVTQLLNVALYEPPIKSDLQAKGSFPSFIPKTDEERVQNVVTTDYLSTLKKVYDYEGTAYMSRAQNVDLVDMFLEEGQNLVKGGPGSNSPQLPGSVYYVSEKLDGTSFTAYIYEGEFGICSRNQELKIEEGITNVYTRVAEKYDLETEMRSVSSNPSSPFWPTQFAIQGEIVGPGVQGNVYDLPELKLYVYSIFDVEKQTYVAVDTMIQMASSMGIDCCPFRTVIPTPFVTHLLYSDRESFQKPFGGEGYDTDMIKVAELRREHAEYSSVNNPEGRVPRVPEGEVYRPFWSIPRDAKDKLTFKVINNAYLLKEK